MFKKSLKFFHILILYEIKMWLFTLWFVCQYYFDTHSVLCCHVLRIGDMEEFEKLDEKR